MHKLVSELTRLYLPQSSMPALEGETSLPVSLVNADGCTRALVIAFDKPAGGDDAQHWTLLCLVANRLQTELDFPAPAVSISGAHGYRLWLSFAAPMPASLVRQFMELLHRAYFPAMGLAADAAGAPVALPPCLDPDTGRWSAFINPGLGASFADEAGLDMAPPLAGQAALLENVNSISAAQLQHAFEVLQQAHGDAPVPSASPMATAPGLLLKDATLEQIVAHLHGLHIEPTFRHLVRPG